MAKITFVYGNDWEGMYVDGKLSIQGHRIHADEALVALGIELCDNVYPDQQWLESQGYLPRSLCDVVKDKE